MFRLHIFEISSKFSSEAFEANALSISWKHD